jgi:hypothetical protein
MLAPLPLPLGSACEGFPCLCEAPEQGSEQGSESRVNPRMVRGFQSSESNPLGLKR